MYKSCKENKLISLNPTDFKILLKYKEMHSLTGDGFPRQLIVLQLPFRHFIETADIYLKMLAISSFSCKMHYSGVAMIEVAGHLAFLKIFPLPLGVMVENFTIENSSLQLAENLWL